MRRPRVPIAVFVAACAIALACNALTGVGDLGAGPCTDCIAPSDARTADVADSVDGPGTTDGPGPDTAIDAGDGGHPSFCEGLVLYAPFDGDYATTQGGAPDMLPANPFSLGKHGQGWAGITWSEPGTS